MRSHSGKAGHFTQTLTVKSARLGLELGELLGRSPGDAHGDRARDALAKARNYTGRWSLGATLGGTGCGAELERSVTVDSWGGRNWVQHWETRLERGLGPSLGRSTGAWASTWEMN
jgi:hypothetical protein